MELETIDRSLKEIEENCLPSKAKLDNLSDAKKAIILGFARWQIDILAFKKDPPAVFVRFGESKLERIIAEWNYAEENFDPQAVWVLRPMSQGVYLRALTAPSYGHIQENLKKLGEWLQSLPSNYDFPEEDFEEGFLRVS